eukprot:TRINITY_DN4918_c0_g2_i12.p1 TRINITY_DN4918_c0_g2~~TRINITY_DN4918_c0_g2_i12.p1  ORF type:complete len:413 (+),score=38.39 TRINITY_DN4918_c0_g2_i12:514-1752(+)
MFVQLETVILLGFGSCIGYFIRGFTGFGSGLIIFANWILWSTLGFNVASIPVVIVGELITNMVIAVPFLIVTNACQTADWGHFFPITFCKNVAFIFGALVLKSITPKTLELVLAVVLLVIVALKYIFVLRAYAKKRSQQKKSADNFFQKQEVQEDLEKSLLSDEAEDDDKVSAQNEDENDPVDLSSEEDDVLPISSSSSSEDGKKPDEEKQISQVQNNTEDKDPQAGCFGGCGPRTWNCTLFHLQCISYILTCRASVQKVPDDQIDNYYTNFSIENGKLYIKYNDRWTRHLFVLMLSGSLAGFLGGMVGIQGPPLMYGFQYLQLPKNVARGNMAVVTLTNIGIIVYIYFGAFYPEYWLVYTTDALLGVVGLVAGSYFSKYLTSQSYYHVLMGLMFFAATVLFLRGVGVVPEA